MAAPLLVFNEATGTLQEEVPAANGTPASLTIDGLGEEWLFVGAAVRSPAKPKV